MAQINLLPWREERRQELKKEFLITTGLVIALAVGLVFLADRVVDGQIQHQKARNQYLADNIKILDAQVAEIRELQKKRNQLLDDARHSGAAGQPADHRAGAGPAGPHGARWRVLHESANQRQNYND